MKNLYSAILCMACLLVILTGCGNGSSTSATDSLDGMWSNSSEQELVVDEFDCYDEYDNWLGRQDDTVHFTDIQFSKEQTYTNEDGYQIEEGTYDIFLYELIAYSGNYYYNWTDNILYIDDETLGSNSFGYDVIYNGMSMELRRYDSNSSIIYLTKSN